MIEINGVRINEALVYYKELHEEFRYQKQRMSVGVHTYFWFTVVAFRGHITYEGPIYMNTHSFGNQVYIEKYQRLNDLIYKYQFCKKYLFAFTLYITLIVSHRIS